MNEASIDLPEYSRLRGIRHVPLKIFGRISVDVMMAMERRAWIRLIVSSPWGFPCESGESILVKSFWLTFDV